MKGYREAWVLWYPCCYHFMATQEAWVSMLKTQGLHMDPKCAFLVTSGVCFHISSIRFHMKKWFSLCGAFCFLVFVYVFGLLALLCFKDQFCQALVHGQCMTELILKTQDVFLDRTKHNSLWMLSFNFSSLKTSWNGTLAERLLTDCH